MDAGLVLLVLHAVCSMRRWLEVTVTCCTVRKREVRNDH